MGFCPETTDFSNITDYYFVRDGFENRFRMAQLAGFNMDRVWGDWFLVEPEENKFNKAFFQLVMDLSKKYGLGVMFCVGGDMACRADAKRRYVHFPAYLHIYHRSDSNLPSHGADRDLYRGIFLPPPAIFEKYLSYILEWGDQVKVWEVLNEPNGTMTAEEYLRYLRLSYKAIKTRRPDAIVLGNGVTGDFGLKSVKWCEELSKADPDYENYLDGVAFHPYGAELDYRKGSYFSYSGQIEDIRGTLKHKKPLWNTECFYLTNSRKPQIDCYFNQGICGAGEAQRHLLESMMNGIAGMTPFDESVIYKRNAPVTIPAPSEVFAAVSSLASLIKDMERIEVVSFNKYIKAGMFVAKDGERAVGFVYDLRPAGCAWVVPDELGGARILDLFGNPVPAVSTQLAVSYEPYYIRGSPESVRALLQSQYFKAKDAVKINARTFRDRLYVEAKSDLGAANSAELEFGAAKGLKLPEGIEVVFADGVDRCTARFDGAVGKECDLDLPLSWKLFSMGEEAARGALKVLPRTGAYDIPFGGASPLALRLGEGSLAWIGADTQSLEVKVEVKDTDIVAAEKKNLWDGDALEIFIDPNPFSCLDKNDLLDRQAPLNVSQYVFAVLPSMTGDRITLVNRKYPGMRTAATSQVTRTADGYVLTASIPWSEITPDRGDGDVLGLDLEIDHASKTGNMKEALGGKPGVSFRERLHYPLFSRQASASLWNAGGWCVEGGASPQVKRGKEYGLFGDGGVQLNVPAGRASGMNRLVKGVALVPGAYHRVNVWALVKAEDIARKADGRSSGLWLSVCFGDAAGKYLGHYNHPAPPVGAFGWRLLQFSSMVPGDAAGLTVSAGLDSGVAGKLDIDNIGLSFE